MSSDTQTLIDREELARFEESLQGFLKKDIDADRFQSMRLQQGVYGQRQEGVNMVRVKLPGGRLSAQQLRACGQVLSECSEHDKAHITTRQDIQIHYVPLPKVPQALNILADAELTSREACNNTVRNISACPLASVCPREHVDITPFYNFATRHFLRHPLTQHLPRKFKMSFSGCESDCAQGMMHDLAVIAVHGEWEFGFKVLAGGGLGHKPHQAIVVEEFISENDLMASMEAIIALHNRYSDRKKRARSRIKFLVDRFGAEDFVARYREELVRTRTALADLDTPRGHWQLGAQTAGYDNPGAPRQVLPQKQSGFSVVPVSVPIGDLTAEQMSGLADLLASLALDDLLASQDQNLIIFNVPDARVGELKTGLQALALDVPRVGDDVVACPGTSTCRLGITSSKTIATKVSGGSHDLRIRASGCHNGCAQPETGDIGIYGEGKRRFGKLIPHYQMYIGGDGRNHGALAIKGPTVPAARIELAIERLKSHYDECQRPGESFFNWSQRQEEGYFKTLLADIAEVAEADVNSVLLDHGDVAAFKVEQFGGGECAGAAQETVAANFAEAANERNYRNAFLFQRKYEESMECAVEVARLVGESLLFLAGHAPVEGLPVIAKTLVDSLKQDSDLGARLAGLASELEALGENFDDARYQAFNESLDAWTVDAAVACQNIDQQLDLSASIPKVVAEKKTA